MPALSWDIPCYHGGDSGDRHQLLEAFLVHLSPDHFSVGIFGSQTQISEVWDNLGTSNVLVCAGIRGSTAIQITRKWF